MMKCSLHPFGILPDGQSIEKIDLENSNGLKVSVINWGGTLQAVHAPDKDGRIADIQPSNSNLDSCLTDAQYRGVTVGRYANRIANACFSINGKDVRLDANEPPHALHGGKWGFDRQRWTIESCGAGKIAWARMHLVSPDGDQGYPGRLEVVATWLLNDQNELFVLYEATSDASTIVNLTHHGYWNLAGDRLPASAQRHLLQSPAERFTPIDADHIPVGQPASVDGTPFDFRKATVLSDRLAPDGNAQLEIAKGFDHFFWTDGNAPGALRMIARLCDPVSGRTMEIVSNQPGFQLYTGAGDSIAIEAQRAPDTPNRPEFGSAQLDPENLYLNATIYRLSWDAMPDSHKEASLELGLEEPLGVKGCISSHIRQLIENEQRQAAVADHSSAGV